MRLLSVRTVHAVAYPGPGCPIESTTLHIEHPHVDERDVYEDDKGVLRANIPLTLEWYPELRCVVARKGQYERVIVESNIRDMTPLGVFTLEPTVTADAKNFSLPNQAPRRAAR